MSGWRQPARETWEATISKPQSPTPPSPTTVAGAQTGTNVATALANRELGLMNQTGPNGSVTYDQSGTSSFRDPTSGITYQLPRYTQTTTLSPEQERLRQLGNTANTNLAEVGVAQSGRIGDLLGRDIDTSGLPSLTADFSADRQRVEDALRERMRPELDRARTRRETDLANRGVRMESVAYDRAQDSLGRSENDADLAAILAGGQEQSRLTTMNNATRGQGLAETLALRNQPLNEIIGLTSGTQIGAPQFGAGAGAGGANIPTTDVAGLFQNGYQNQMGVYGQQTNAYNSNVGAAAGLAAAAMMSDETLKKDKDKIGKVPVAGIGGGMKNLDVFRYRYKDEGKETPKHTGVMAQDVEKVRPDAVIETPKGKAVQYGKLFGIGGMRRAA